MLVALYVDAPQEDPTQTYYTPPINYWQPLQILLHYESQSGQSLFSRLKIQMVPSLRKQYSPWLIYTN